MNWDVNPTFDGGVGVAPGQDAIGFNLTTWPTNYISIVDGSYSILSLSITGNNGVAGLILNQANSGSLTISSSLTDSASSPVNINVPIMGGATLTNSGGGTLTLNGANNYSGTTSVTGSSVLTDGAANSFSPNSQISLANCASLIVATSSETINGLAGSSNTSVTIGSGDTLITTGSSCTDKFAGTITGGTFEIGTGGDQILTGTGSVAAVKIDNGGTLELGDGGTQGLITGTVADCGTLVFNNPSCTTFTGVISGSGGNVSVEGGMVTLSGQNTYGGTTSVSGMGQLEDGAAGAFSPFSLVSLSNCANLTVNNAETINGLSGDSNTTVTITPSGTTLTITGTACDSPFAGKIQGCGSLEIGAGGYEILTNTNNSYSGSTTIDNGATLKLGDGESSGMIASNVQNCGTLVFDENGCVTFNQTISGSSGAVEFAGGMVTLLGTSTYGGGTTIDCMATLELGNSDNPGTIEGPIVNNGTLVFNKGTTSYTGVISGSNGTVTVQDNPLTLDALNTYGGKTTVNGVTLTDGEMDSFSPNSQMALESGATLAVTFNEAINGLSGSCDTSVNITSGDTLKTTGSSCTDKFAGTITGGTFEIGTGGDQILTGTGSVAAVKIDCGGTLELGDGGTQGLITGTVADSGTLVFNNPSCTTFTGVISGSSGTVSVEGGMVTLSGQNTYGGTTSVSGSAQLEDGIANAFSANSLISLSNCANLTVNNAETINGLSGDCNTTVTITPSETTLTITGTACDSPFAGKIQGCGSLEIGAGGYEILTNTGNSYSGSTTIDNGATLKLGDGESSGMIASNVQNCGTLVFDENGCVTFNQTISGSSGAVEFAGGMVTLLGTSTYGGGTTIDCMATLDLGNSENPGTIEGPIVNNGTLVFNKGTTSYTGVISGSNGTVTVQDNPLTLDALNTYGGKTTVNGVTLTDGEMDSFSPNSQMSLENGATLAVTFNEAINGLSGSCDTSVNITSGDTLKTTGSSCTDKFAGTITGGTFEIGTGGDQILTGTGSVAAVKIDSGGTLELGDGGTQGLITGTVADSGTLVFNNPSCTTFTGVISGSGGTVSVEGGMVTLSGLNTYGGTTSVSGMSQLEDGTAGAFSANSLISLSNCANLTVNNNEVINGLLGSSNTTVSLVGTASLTTTGMDDPEFAGVISGGGSLVIGPGADQILTNTNGYSGGTTIGLNGTLQLGDGATQGLITGDVLDNGTLAFENPSSTTFNGVISGTGGILVNLKTVTLAGLNTYQGNTVVGGTGAELEDGAAGSFSPFSQINLQTGGSLVLNDNESVHGINGVGGTTVSIFGETTTLYTNGYGSFAGVISGTGGALELGPSGDQILTGMNTYGGGTKIDSGAILQLGDGSVVGSIMGSVVDNGELAFDIPLVYGTYTVSNPISGSGSVIVDGGTVLLDMSNTYSGGTVVGGGTLEVSTSDSALNNGSVTVEGGAMLQIEDGRSLTDPIFLSGVGVGGVGALYSNPGASTTATLSGAITLLGSSTIGSGSGTLVLSGGITGIGHNLTFSGAGNTTVSTSGISLGSGSVTINGAGTKTLSVANSYSGGTTINSSNVNVAVDGALGTGAVNASSSTLTFSGSSPTINGLTLLDTTINFAAGSTPMIINMLSDALGSGNMINLGAGPSTALTFQVNDGDPKYFGVINGTGSLDVETATPGTTSGQLDLEHDNGYTGGTTIGNDALVVAGSAIALGSGPVTVNPGGVLGLDTGVIIGNSVTIVNNGTTGGSIGGYGTLSTATADPILIQGGAGIVGGRGTYGSGTSGSMLPVVGKLTLAGNTSLTFGGGGGMEFSLMDASGASGAALSWSTISTPNLNITASPGSPFTVEIVGIALDQQTIGTAGVFNPALIYNWTFLTSTSPITGFTGSNQFSVYVDPVHLFSNSTLGGTFSVTDSGNSLVLNFTPVPEPSTWALMIGGLCMLVGAAVRRRRRA